MRQKVGFENPFLAIRVGLQAARFNMAHIESVI